MLDKLLIGDYRIDERMMIEGYIESNGEREEFYAFNDVVIKLLTIFILEPVPGL
jgi:NAD kinase